MIIADAFKKIHTIERYLYEADNDDMESWQGLLNRCRLKLELPLREHGYHYQLENDENMTDVLSFLNSDQVEVILSEPPLEKEKDEVLKAMSDIMSKGEKLCCCEGKKQCSGGCMINGQSNMFRENIHNLFATGNAVLEEFVPAVVSRN